MYIEKVSNVRDRIVGQLLKGVTGNVWWLN